MKEFLKCLGIGLIVTAALVILISAAVFLVEYSAPVAGLGCLLAVVTYMVYLSRNL